MNNQKNLWNIIHLEITKGELEIYYPYDPEWFETKDDGNLSFPFYGQESSKNIVNDLKTREKAFGYELLGYYGMQPDYPLTTMWGEDSVIVLPNGMIETVYPPREHFWFSDLDIIKYRIKEDVVISKSGKEKSYKSNCTCGL